MRRTGRVCGALLVPLSLLAGGCWYPNGGELGTDSVEDRHDLQLTLTPAVPVAVRHLTLAIDPEPSATSADLTVFVTRTRPDPGSVRPDGVSVSVRPDDPAALRVVSPPYEALPGTILSFDPVCRDGCERGLTVVVRASGSEPTDVTVHAQLRVIAPSGAQPTLAGTPEIREDVDRASNHDSLGAAASAVRPVRLTSAAPNAHLDVHVHADGDVIRAAGADALVGSLILRGDGDAETHELIGAYRAPNLGYATMGNWSTSLGAEGTPIDIDWLSGCPPTGDCDVTVGIDMSYVHLASGMHSRSATGTDPPDPDAFRLQIEATAILEALDGRALPSGSVTVTVEPTR